MASPGNKEISFINKFALKPSNWKDFYFVFKIMYLNFLQSLIDLYNWSYIKLYTFIKEYGSNNRF